MIVTDDKAQELFCPMTKVNDARHCIGKLCMAWRWSKNWHMNTVNNKIESGSYDPTWKTGAAVGYCGMAGVSEL